MELSEDEAEALPLTVSNYHFEDDNDEPVSFSVLPIQWSEGEKNGDEQVWVFLHGNADNGLRKIFKHVIAWKFELSNEKPELFVLSKDNNWIKLLKPRKTFENIVRSILITVHFLHFVMRNPETSGKPLWNHISSHFSLHEVKAFESEVVGHMSLISEAFRRNDALAKSNFLVQFLNRNPKKRKLPDEDFKSKVVSGFVVDLVDDSVDVAEEDNSCESHDIYDNVCAFCDEGGDLLCCEGRCLRSFHATMRAALAAESHCDSLGLTQDEVDAIPNFLCRNCEYKQHQCFICGVLGSSDTSSGAQVFSCASATCGRFYHPHCISRLLDQDNKDSVEELDKKIAEGRPFTCPIHKCYICKRGENKKDPDLQFAVCRRCPKSYHRKCLPREIGFIGNKEELIVRRAWEDVLPNRILMYCLEHEMDENIRTLSRGHIKFPHADEKKSDTKKRKTSTEENKTKHTLSKSPGDSGNTESKTKILASEECYHVTAACETLKQNEKTPSSVKGGGSIDIKDVLSEANVPVKVHANDAFKKKLKSPMAEEGGSFEVAKAGCEPEILSQIFNWKNQIKLYLAPFVPGVFYASAHQHFTIVDKLEEIVNKLHCYLQEGDTIVDIGFGHNDFSLLMKNKLEEMGYRCLYQNYDLVQFKNDTNSEKRNWMTVQQEELPTGSKLVMGLNLPSGVKATVANKVIDKALEFKPKLLLLILPREAGRFNEKRLPYDTVWEDRWLLSGKPFYLSGSVDSNEKQTKQSNAKPPVLYLWSRPDWSSKHKSIAEKYGHLSMQQKPLENIHTENLISNRPVSNRVCYDAKSKQTSELHRHKSLDHKRFESREKSGEQQNHTKDVRAKVEITTEHKSETSCSHTDSGGHSNQNFRNRMSTLLMEKQQKQNEAKKHGREKVETPTESKSEMNHSHVEVGGNSHQNFCSRLSPSPVDQQKQQNDTKKDGRAKVETISERKSEMSPPRMELGGGSHQYFRLLVSPMRSATAYGGKRSRTSDDESRRLEMNGAQHIIEHYGAPNSPGSRQHINSNDEKLRKESDMHSQDSYSSGSNHVAGQNSGHSQMGTPTLNSHCGTRSSVTEPSYPNNASAMQQPQSSLYIGSSLPRNQGVSMDFASRPNEAYSRQHSAGWIDE